ncbi:c-type cytochrome biogenesis protein CcsB [Ornithinimicrobium cerasi]|uniref:Cytochrome c-type biogenesis protein CcsB n=1 Tax=Ornithinimicrobium cerasi TaxID=2248773 RepID=A0A285VQN4_9MICO|nr:c-type cytochrome biogenesis protein CcsB [Ornithinimicrobium cerasi]SOC56380.1 cytochrome c-type biogenesis protein CcsB [Ornithinimicrobium cerasi]
MTDPTLALASDYAVWTAIVVLALALLAFCVHLAVTGSARERRADRLVRERERVGAAVGGAEPADRAGADDAHGDHGRAHPTREADARTGTPSRRWGVIGLQLTWLATFAVLGGTVLRALSVSRAPLGNMYEFALGTVSFALVIYSVWALRKDRLWLGAFVVGPALVILGAAKLSWYTEASQLMPALDNIWLVIHVTIAVLATALFVIGAALAVAYLLRDRAERRGEVSGWLSALPRATALERMTYGMHIVAFPLWTFTVIAGAIWAEQAWGRYWGWDPKETWSFVIWVVYAAYLHARATTGWSTRQATWVALVGFVCLILNYTAVNLLMTGLHSYSGVST